MKTHIHVIPAKRTDHDLLIESPEVKSKFKLTKSNDLVKADWYFSQTFRQHKKIIQRRIPYIAYSSGDIWKTERRNSGAGCGSGLHKFFENAKAIIFITEFLRDIAINNQPGLKAKSYFLPGGLWGITHTPFGCPDKMFMRDVKQPQRKKIQFLTSINLSVKRKFDGVPLFMDMIKPFREKYRRRIRIVNIGKGAKHPELIKEWLQLYGIQWIEYAPYKKWAEYLKASDVYLHPSLFDTFGRNISNAMFAGLPVVGLDYPYSNKVSDSALWFKSSQSKELNQTMEDLLDEDYRKELGQKSLAEAIEKTEKHKYDFVNILERICR